MHDADEIGFLQQARPGRDGAERLFFEQPRAFVQQVLGEIFGCRLSAHALEGEPTDQHRQSGREKSGEEDENRGKRQHLAPPTCACQGYRRCLFDGARGHEDQQVFMFPVLAGEKLGSDLGIVGRVFEQENRRAGEL